MVANPDSDIEGLMREDEEDDEQFEKRLRGFSAKLGRLIDAESSHDGLAACIVGYGIGWALGTGATEQEVREVFEQVLQKTLAERPFSSQERN